MTEEEKLNIIKNNINLNKNLNISETQEPKYEEAIIQYKKIPPDLNTTSLKYRFTCKKILELMDNKKDIEITYDELNDPSKAGIAKEKLNKKLIQYYCLENVEKNKFALPSSQTIAKIKQFKKWQNFEIFKKNGIQNYINNVMPDYKQVFETKKLIDNNIKIYKKIKIIKPPAPDTQNFPKINNNQINFNFKSLNMNNNKCKSRSYISLNDRCNYKSTFQKNKSMDETKFNSSISKILQLQHNTSSRTHLNKNPKINTVSNNRSLSLLINSNINSTEHMRNIKKVLINFKKSHFCATKIKVPSFMDKSVKSTPYGGGLLYVNSFLRKKNINDFVSIPSQRKLISKLREYKTQRNKIINSKDYLKYIRNTFITTHKGLSNYDYYVF